MAYITLDDLVARYGEAEMVDIADRDRDGVPDPDVLAAVIGDAERDIDAQLGGRYQVPLASVPDLVKRLACQLARYYLHRVQPPEWVRSGYSDAMRQLGEIRDGRVSLDGVAPAPAPVQASAGRVAGVSEPRVFTPSNLRGF
ncbi:MAG TPA: DUF1320 domain-containing protein [Candidatus Omnitrophota bacterium]|nr:DUF1320 domain-containing protein [Candidatus Omnitrophota bacterium]